MTCTTEKKLFERLSNLDLFIIEKELNQLDATIQKFIATILDQPFIALFAVWLKKYGNALPGIYETAATFLDHNLIKLHDDKENIWTLQQVNAETHKRILTAIRSTNGLSIRRKEELVQLYTAFMQWLHTETKGLIRQCEDPDKIQSANRQLPYTRFIDFLDALTNAKSQLVAKLLYFGNSNLDSILGLTISDIDFSTQTIATTRYPEHILHDVKTLIDSRKTGLLFLGRNDVALSDATIFRHFNEAAEKVGLGNSFGPKKLSATH